jgi:hypothetical protein
MKKVTPRIIDGEPTGNADCDYHSNGKCTHRGQSCYLMSCLPSCHTVCVPGLREQRDRLREQRDALQELNSEAILTKLLFERKE